MPQVMDHARVERELADLDRERFNDLPSVYRSVCRTASSVLAVERVAILYFTEGGDHLRCVHAYDVRYGHRSGGVSLPTTECPSYMQAIRDGRIVAVEHAASSPHTRELVDHLDREGVRSFLDVPIRKDGELIGVLCHQQRGQTRCWQPIDMLVAASLGDQLAKRISEENCFTFSREVSRFRGLVERAPFSALLVSTQGQLEYANVSAKDLLGLPGALNAAAFGLNDLFNAEAGQRINTEAYRAALQGHIWQDICEVNCRGASTVPAAVTVYRHGEAQSTDHVLAIIIRPIIDEITDKYAAIPEDHSQYLAVIDHLWEGLLLLDPESLTVVDANQTALDMLGFAHDELKQRTIYELSRVAPSDIQEYARLVNQKGSYIIEESKHMLRSDGTTIPVAAKASLIDVQTRKFICLFVHDLSDQEAFRREVEQVLLYQPATGLPSAHSLRERGEQALAAAAQTETPAALVVLRIRQYVETSDLLGPEEMECFEARVAEALQIAADGADLIAHSEQDAEFAILDRRVQDADSLQSYMVALLAALQTPIRIGEQQLPVQFAAGAALFPMDGANIRELTRHATIACRYARQMGGSHALYDPVQKSRFRNRVLLEQQLRKALDNGELSLVYQPVVTARDTSKMLKAEALLRWDHPNEGRISPSDFIPIAETSGLMPVLDRYVLHRALSELSEWSGAHSQMGVAVNLSAQTLSRQDTVALVEGALRDNDMPPERLFLEITETAAMTDWHAVQACMRALSALGVRFALDDFGTGYSSLSYLKHLPTQILKIDREFVEGIGRDARDESTIRTIIALAREHGMCVVAEGVDTPAQLEWLQSQGVDLIQGFLIARPKSPPDLQSWLARQQRAHPNRRQREPHVPAWDRTESKCLERLFPQQESQWREGMRG